MRGKGGMGASCWKKLPESRAFTEFRFCVPTADTAEQTHKLMREGEKIPISTTKRLGLFLDVLSSSQLNDELCS